MRKNKKVLYGWKHKSIEEKIKKMISLPLGKRYECGIAKGELARILEKNQERLNGRGAFRSIQVLKQT